MPGPLSGVRIVDFTAYQNGPSAIARMVDEGAECLKVEPFIGDGVRQLGLPGKMNAGFESYNRGKKSLMLDIKHPKAAAVMRRLVRWADVLAENFRPGVMDRLGFSYEKCCEWNPRLIYASNSGFGPVGEMAHRPSYDAVAQSYAGVTAVMGGGVSHTPRLVEWQFSDEVGAMHFYGSILAALFTRERSGEGQRVTTSQTAATLYFQRAKMTGTIHIGKQRDSGPSGQGGQFYKAGDGRWICVAPTTPKNRADFYGGVLGLAAVFKAAKARGKEGMKELEKASKAVIADRSVPELLRRCAELSVPVAQVNGYMDIAKSEHLRDNGYIRDMQHREWGKMTTITAPTAFSKTPVDNASAPHGPRLGEHTEESLATVGFTAAEVAELAAQSVVRQAKGASARPRL